MDIAALATSPVVLGLIPIVWGLVEAVKMAFGMNTRYAALVSVVIGIALAMVVGTVSGAAVLTGILVGLGASGLHSGVKATING